MPDLTTLRAARDVARASGCLLMENHDPEEYRFSRKDLDALLLAERRLALAEMAEALDAGAGPKARDQHREGWIAAASFLRARIETEGV